MFIRLHVEGCSSYKTKYKSVRPSVCTYKLFIRVLRLTIYFRTQTITAAEHRCTHKKRVRTTNYYFAVPTYIFIHRLLVFFLAHNHILRFINPYGERETTYISVGRTARGSEGFFSSSLTVFGRFTTYSTSFFCTIFGKSL